MGSERTGHRLMSAVVLSCKHVVKIEMPTPTRGDEQWCRRCADYRRVEVTPPNYVASCSSGRCRFTRSGGADKDKAMNQARAHVQKMSRHVVEVRDNGTGRLVAKVSNTDEELFASGEELQQMSSQLQGMLKELRPRGVDTPVSVD